MALHKLERGNYGGKLPVSIKYQNLHSFKEGLILLCTVSHRCQGKRKKLPAKEKFLLQKKDARGKKEIGQDKRRKLAAKEKF